jgi:hypothetical protein
MMDADSAKKLRAPFKPAQIGKLPKPTKRENPKGKCPECGGWHGLPAVHLDYVGHAAVTDRLLEVDPEWTWEPMARGDHGEPLLMNGGLWINLTVCGVTRPGFGDDTSGKGMKEIIGDAIRNASMRFGVALDLWTKEDLHATESGAATAEGTPKAKPRPAAKEAASAPADLGDADTNGHTVDVKYASEPQRKRLFAIAKEQAVESARLREILFMVTGQESTAQIPADKYDAVVAAVEAEGVPA